MPLSTRLTRPYSRLGSGLVFGLASGLLASLGLGLIALPTLAQVTTEPSPEASPAPSPSATAPRFACQSYNGQPTVMYLPESQPGQAYAWAVPTALGGGWSPERRCTEISRRLESYRPDGLVEMQTSVENGYNTVCVTTERNTSCRIVLTVPPGQDPISTRDRIFQNLTVADSGQQTQGVITFTGASRNQGDILGELGSVLGGDGSGISPIGAPGLNLKPFLDGRDGGTGSQLQGGVTNGRRLNPGNFR